MTHQGDIFQQITPATTAGVPANAFAEICTALYERELKQLAQQQQVSISLLQRRLQSLPYHVQNAARGMLEGEAPYTLDVQNASWQAPQKRRLNLSSGQAKKLQKWLTHEAKLGDTVPIFDLNLPIQQVRLDSIDRIDKAQARVHCNMHGWFNFLGESLETADAGNPEPNLRRLVRPDKTNLAPALCGHQWNHRGKIDPRTLSLREVLLATTIDF